MSAGHTTSQIKKIPHSNEETPFKINASILWIAVLVIALISMLFLFTTEDPNLAEAAPLPQGANATRAATPSPNAWEVTTQEGARVYPGPGTDYPWMAIYSAGITLTVAGENSLGNWLAVEVSPYNQGWIRASEVITSTPLDGLPLAAEPSGLATVTPVPRVELSLTAFDGHYQFMNINSKGVFGTVREPALVYEVTTAEALQSFVLEVFSPTGKLVYKRRLKTDDEGTYENAVMTKDFKTGAYTVRATLWNGVVKEVVVQVTGDSS